MKTLKVSLKAIVFILATAASLTVNAADSKGNNKNTISSALNVNVAHAGVLNSDPLVELSFDNPTDEKVLVTVKDETGVVVYSEIFSGKHYSKKFLFEIDLANANPVISVKYLSSDKTETYKVTVNDVTTLPGLVITKL